MTDSEWYQRKIEWLKGIKTMLQEGYISDSEGYKRMIECDYRVKTKGKDN